MILKLYEESLCQLEVKPREVSNGEGDRELEETGEASN